MGSSAAVKHLQDINREDWQSRLSPRQWEIMQAMMPWTTAMQEQDLLKMPALDQENFSDGGIVGGVDPESDRRRYEKLANDVSSLGRYGDTTMMHVNPLEVEVLDRLTPGGLSTNPDTGKKEAVAWLLPLVMAAGSGIYQAESNPDEPWWRTFGTAFGTSLATSAVTAGAGSLLTPATDVATNVGANVASNAATNVGANVGAELINQTTSESLKKLMEETTAEGLRRTVEEAGIASLMDTNIFGQNPGFTQTGAFGLPDIGGEFVSAVPPTQNITFDYTPSSLGDFGPGSPVSRNAFTERAMDINRQAMDDVVAESVLGKAELGNVIPDVPEMGEGIFNRSIPARISGEFVGAFNDLMEDPISTAVLPLLAAEMTSPDKDPGDPWGYAFPYEGNDPYWGGDVTEGGRPYWEDE